MLWVIHIEIYIYITPSPVLCCSLPNDFDVFIQTEVLKVGTPPFVIVEDAGMEVPSGVNCNLLFASAPPHHPNKQRELEVDVADNKGWCDVIQWVEYKYVGSWRSELTTWTPLTSLSCDIRLKTRKAKFSIPFSNAKFSALDGSTDCSACSNVFLSTAAVITIWYVEASSLVA